MLREKVKNIIILSLVCAGLLGISPISSAILNNHSIDIKDIVKSKVDDKEVEEEVIYVDNTVRGKISPVSSDSKPAESDKKESKVQADVIDEYVNTDKASKSSDVDVDKNYSSDKKTVDSEQGDASKQAVDKNNEEMIYTDIEDIDEATLSPQDAENVLKKYDSSVDYRYMGNADDFEALKKDHRSGQVFLPKVPTDIGYYVEKGTNKIYYFHPSGYLEEAK